MEVVNYEIRQDVAVGVQLKINVGGTSLYLSSADAEDLRDKLNSAIVRIGGQELMSEWGWRLRTKTQAPTISKSLPTVRRKRKTKK